VKELQNVLKRIIIFGVSAVNIDEMLGPSPGSNHSADPQKSPLISSLLSGYLGSIGGYLPEFSAL